MTTSTPSLGAVALLVLLYIASSSVALENYFPPPRLLAIGDLHGDIENAKSILRFAQIIDCDDHWISGKDTVIQLGDVVDRGPHGHSIIEFFATLREEASRASGEFIQLLGNHELMNMQADLKFVNPKTSEVFGGADRLKEAFDPVSGAYGSYLVEHCDTAVVRNRTVFVHGGLLPSYAALGVFEVNRRVRQAIRAKNFSDPILMGDGPLWTREIIYPAQRGNCTAVRASLAELSRFEVAHGRPSVDRMVIGHTIMHDGAIHSLCDGALLAIDIAISQYFVGGGHLGILELRYDFAQHTDHVVPHIQYPSQPFRQHPLLPVEFPKRIPLPLFNTNRQTTEGAALTIQSADSATMTSMELLMLGFGITAAAALVLYQYLQQPSNVNSCIRTVTGRWRWLRLSSKVKGDDDGEAF